MSDKLTIDEISRWLRIKQEALSTTDVECMIDQGPSEAIVPAVFADFFTQDAAGRITGWVSGHFDFEVIHTSRLLDRWFRHIEVTAPEELDSVFSEFETRLRG